MIIQLIACALVMGVSLAVFAVPAVAQEDLPGPSPRAGWPVAAPRLSAEQALATLPDREQHLLRNLANQPLSDPAEDLYGNRAIARLQLGLDPAEANAHLRWIAGWFERPHPRDRHIRGESDFAAIRLARAYYLFRERDALEPATLQAIARFFQKRNFQSIYHSENHHLLFRVSRYLMGTAYPQASFEAWKRTGAELAEEDAAWLERFIQYRAAHGWGEFDSSSYIRPDMEALLCLYDFAPHQRLKQLAGMALDVLLADMAVDSINGMMGGAQGRIYTHQALDHAAENTWPIQYVYFGNVDARTLEAANAPEPAVDTLTSTYRPQEIVVRIALERPEPYLNRERKHLHNLLDPLPRVPLAGSIRKSTWYTSHYVLGCVQQQDPYPADAPVRTRNYALHQQHDWDLTIGSNTRARLFTHHPGNEGHLHGYWTGDLKCGCGRFFQQGPVLLALYAIPADQPYQSIHAYLPREAFDEVTEADGFIFLRKGDVYVAFTMLGGHRWVEDGPWAGVEVRGPGFGGRHAVVCEVGLASDYPDFSTFSREIASNPLHFDPEAMELTYTSQQAGKLSFTHAGRREVDGQPIDLDYATFDSPYLQSAWGSGVVDLIHGDQRLRLDFPHAAMKELDRP